MLGGVGRVREGDMHPPSLARLCVAPPRVDPPRPSAPSARGQSERKDRRVYKAWGGRQQRHPPPVLASTPYRCCGSAATVALEAPCLVGGQWGQLTGANGVPMWTATVAPQMPTRCRPGGQERSYGARGASIWMDG